MSWLAASIFTIAMCLAFGTEVRAEKRIALVIGNSAYQHTPELKNPRNDAADVAHSGEGDQSFRRMATTYSGRWRPGGAGA